MRTGAYVSSLIVHLCHIARNPRRVFDHYYRASVHMTSDLVTAAQQCRQPLTMRVTTTNTTKSVSSSTNDVEEAEKKNDERVVKDAHEGDDSVWQWEWPAALTQPRERFIAFADMVSDHGDDLERFADERRPSCIAMTSDEAHHWVQIDYLGILLAAQYGTPYVARTCFPV